MLHFTRRHMLAFVAGKQLIAGLGARSLKEVNPDDYEPLVKAVQALGTGGDGDA